MIFPLEIGGKVGKVEEDGERRERGEEMSACRFGSPRGEAGRRDLRNCNPDFRSGETISKGGEKNES